MTITDLKHCLDNIKENLLINDAKAEVLELKWGQNLEKFNKIYDYILGADIIYFEETFCDLEATLNDLSGPNTKVLLSCKIRYPKDQRFLKNLENKFSSNNVFYDENFGIHIFLFQKIKKV